MTENWTEIGEASVNFQEHLRASIKYPEVFDNQNRLRIVPLDIVISKEGVLELVEYSKAPGPIAEAFMHTHGLEFVEEAKRLVKSFTDWVPDKIEGQYRNTKRYLSISFFYHEFSLSDPTIVLNPDTRAKYPNKTRRYEYSIQGKYGCDGIGSLIAIIDKEGLPKRVECLDTVGKTNCKVVEQEFLSLGKWEPALLHGKPVNSHIVLSIYT